MFARILACAALLSTTGAAAAEPRQPTGKWIVNFADAQCVATRNYGSEADPLYLVLKAPATGGTLQVAVVRKSARDDATQYDGEVVFDETAAVRTSLIEFGNKKMGQRAMLANLSADKVAPIRKAKVIGIRVREEGISRLGTRLATNVRKAEESFAVTQMPELTAMLDTCAADLRKIWRVWNDEKGSDGLKEGPTGDLSKVFSGDDYPAIALVEGEMGSTAFVLLIDEQGKVADCTVTEPSGVASLDAQSCAIVKERAKFRPAIGLDGKPSKSSYSQRITWRLER
jgi:TonB family protein